MNVTDALKSRRSIRQFEQTEVPQVVLDRILENALRSPSGSNSQPYRIAVARGQVRDQIREELCEKYDKVSKIRKMSVPRKFWHGLTANVLPDGDFNPDKKYPEELHQRKFDCGMGLYNTLGIERADRIGRERQMKRNFEFFDAPVAVFVFINQKLGYYSALDAGIFIQSLMLAAVGEGLGTCTQAALAIWASPVRKHFVIEKDYKLLCGISLGYPADHIVNTYQPAKRSLDNVSLPVVQTMN